jgi:hypothetical protein
MQYETKKKLITWLENGQTEQALAFLKFIKTDSPTRTQAQHNALFLWYSMIEKMAENEGITWNQLVGKTHQLRITTEGLHVMGKQLQKALWGTTSTKELKKTEQIDVLVDHFVDLFSKVGLVLPPFPHEEQKSIAMTQVNNRSREDYPAYETPTI